MMRTVFLLLLLIIVTMMTACSSADYSDLESFVNDSSSDLQGKIDPLPEVKLHKSFIYQAFDIFDPFVPRANGQTQNASNGISPDLNRQKEILESYPLESLSLVGSLQQNSMVFALIKSPDGILHRVKKGNHLGHNFGKIEAISEMEVSLKEIVQNGTTEWVEKQSALILKN
ncbi:MAG: pilus assembly protein PilP [Pseudomonadota bacterium]